MREGKGIFLTRLRACLVLGRVSNLPTVWSNCIAAWWLGGRGEFDLLVGVCLSGSCLYLGGMFLNDAFDAAFDRQYRTERPIPAGHISERAVWIAGTAWLAAGLGILGHIGPSPFLLGTALAGSILVYDAVHKMVIVAPVLMALCRFFLYLVAAATAEAGIQGLVMWSALALAAYIVGLSYIARRESTGGALRLWPLLFLGAPLFLAIAANPGAYRGRALLLCLIFALWSARALRTTLTSGKKDISRTVSHLLAGIVLVDWLAVSDGPAALSFAFLGLFLLALLLQRAVPAT